MLIRSTLAVFECDEFHFLLKSIYSVFFKVNFDINACLSRKKQTEKHEHISTRTNFSLKIVFNFETFHSQYCLKKNVLRKSVILKSA